VNLNSEWLSKAAESIYEGKYKEVHSVLIYRDGRLVFEEYFRGHPFQYDKTSHRGKEVEWGRTKPHRIMSVTKSITSVCIGIAVDKGFIKSVNQPIFDYLPEHGHLKTPENSKIQIEHLLSMTSGLEGNEWLLPYNHPQNAVILIYNSKDPINQILSKPALYPAGGNFQYCGSSNFLLAEILKNATGKNLEEFAAKNLFGPLGIHSYEWLQLNKGVVDGAGGLIMTPRDMLKIGVTFLNNGIWNGQRILSEQWVEKSATPYPRNQWLNNWDDHWGLRGYGYSWWTHTFVKSGKRIPMYYASGWGGQYIMIIPNLQTVVVFTGGNYTTFRPPFEILKKYILNAYLN